jgi:hypothetical protein
MAVEQPEVITMIRKFHQFCDTDLGEALGALFVVALLLLFS